jgi:hypothetical protein
MQSRRGVAEIFTHLSNWLEKHNLQDDQQTRSPRLILGLLFVPPPSYLTHAEGFAKEMPICSE